MTSERPDNMYERAYLGVQKVLDRALGSDWDDGAGEGVIADVELLAYRYRLALDALTAAGATAAVAAIRRAEIPAKPAGRND